ncbi:endonuclease MutS2 [Anaerotruncus colihominis]|uniref:Endonuclease MutS2 n=2 Tax=Anaerotruncus colihominis TaxID=169435 RepID=B0PF50_9FIRM|nr:endonuclease MutS2 [Anaerotruncus colihominis]EDS09983.1 MutS2 family protein [Anaerotruncus colihominis DSM 17241]OUP69672.1 endonuclease MutS2 [Anaerotruncus colihominis]RGE67680.1 endonuclease MutS2 [Anaerotruncus colihominis]UOX64756.1 endonuclease MutS2 [Anaerotruncus colihominis]UWN74023.1 endonuclease MutS2 [Anaerotruncus colihominis]
MDKYCKAIELDKVLMRLARHCSCEDSRALALAIEPARDIRDVRELMRRTVDANTLTNRYSTPSIGGVTNCSAALKRAAVGARLSPRELLDVARVLRAIETIERWRSQLEGDPTSLEFLLDCVVALPSLQRAISTAIVTEDEIADAASPALGDIRRKIRSAGAKAREVLDRLVRSATYQKYLQENIITQRDGRFVVPVRQEYRNEIKGLVHDTSGSGATVFIEPMGVVEANNEIRILQGQEQAEIDRILRELSAQVGACADSIGGSYEAIVELDLYFAKSRLADEMRATEPAISETGAAELKRARHPLLPADRVVPIDLRLGGDFDTLVVTGPNTGGKTVAIKTLGLLSAMAQCGLMLPAADGSTVPVFEKLLVDIGDEQSIEQSLSTFSAHMTNIIRILDEADGRSLVLLDELGAGTDPVEGAALAVAIIERLRAQGAKVVATTHYAEIKMYALNTPGVENASCEFDVATLRPTYRLLIGVPGRSNAFAICERLGLPAGVIEAARAHVSGENLRFEEVVSQLEQTRQELERARVQAESQRAGAQRERDEADALRRAMEQEREREIERARVQARGIVEQAGMQAQKLLDELDELRRQKDSAGFAERAAQAKSAFKANMRRLHDLADPVTRKNIEQYTPERPLKRGDTVRLVSLGREGTVLSAPDGQGFVQVQAGIIKTKVHQSELRLVDTKDRHVTVGGAGVSTRGVSSKASRDVKTEVDLRGMTTDEALMELDRFIDASVLSNVPTVTIIHGKGTGALRAAVQQRLKKHRSVKSFRLGTFGEGESGVTVAELK